MTEKCVCCGAEIPEGRQICKMCELANLEKECDRVAYESNVRWKKWAKRRKKRKEWKGKTITSPFKGYRNYVIKLYKNEKFVGSYESVKTLAGVLCISNSCLRDRIKRGTSYELNGETYDFELILGDKK